MFLNKTGSLFATLLFLATIGLSQTVNAETIERSDRVFYREAARMERERQRTQETEEHPQEEIAQVTPEKRQAQEPEKHPQAEVTSAEPEKRQAQETEKHPQAEVMSAEPEKKQQKASTSDSTRPSSFALKSGYMEGIPISPMAKLPTTQKRLKELCDEVREKYDDMTNITYYSPETIYADPIALYPYLVVDYNKRIMKLMYHSVYMGTHASSTGGPFNITVQNGSANWLNFNTVTVRADNELFEMHYDIGKQFREVRQTSPMIQGGLFGYHHSISCVEEYDEVMDQNSYEIFKAVASAKDVKMRFSGSGSYTDKKMKDKLKNIHKEVLSIFNLLRDPNY